ncbi:glycosyltransferase family 4 protein [Marinobacter sp. SS21]|uniref:glycosyltransferase family 4 protein n=1 Tax=Marinobacter sp. SS21 TaxID=2979460 RepID=UPI00232D6F38|nr:glycosyltransferase family 4 protein [Marinobacter sp. SS21]MDC0663100.1 glycosyltransferase family 4 protein [Marinobacter sp. SS21]
MRVLFIKPHPDASELHLLLSLHRLGVAIRVLASPHSLARPTLEQHGLFIAARPGRGKCQPALIAQIRQLVRTLGITVIHAVDSSSLANAIWASYFTRVRIIGYRGTNSRIRRFDPTYWLGILNPRVARVICVSQAIHDYLARFLPRHKLVLNAKGYSQQWLDSDPTPPDRFPSLPAGCPTVMTIGNSAGRPHKGLRYLIEAFHQTRSDSAHLVVIGDYDADIPELVRSGPAARRIVLAGPQPRAAHWLKWADVYAQPSTVEGLPRAVKEAMAQGVATVITDIPGSTELIEHDRSGLVVPPADPGALARALEQLLGSAALRERLAQAAVHRLQTRFAPERFVQTTLELYRSLDQRRQPGFSRLASDRPAAR